MTDRRPLDADGNPPLKGQMDIDEVVAETMRTRSDRDEAEEERIHRLSREKLNRPMTAAEIVAGRLRGKG